MDRGTKPSQRAESEPARSRTRTLGLRSAPFSLQSEDPFELKALVESLLFVAQEPVTRGQLARAVRVSDKEVQHGLAAPLSTAQPSNSCAISAWKASTTCHPCQARKRHRRELISMKMAKRERLEATIRREPVDRPAVALWRHWPGDDQRAEDLACAQVAFQRRYDFDFMKVTPASSYCLEDWGVVDRWVAGTDEGTREYVVRPVNQAGDWHRLEVLDPCRGALGRQLHCLELIAAQVGGEVPFIQTIFSPLAQAKNLTGDDRLLVHLRRHPGDLRAGLATITETTVRFVREVLRTGAAGIFYAVQHACYGLLCDEEYRHMGRPYDLRVLEAAQEGWFNVLHLHGNDIMFDALADYPVQAINWHDRETWPPLAEASRRCDKALIGGLRRTETMLLGNPDNVRSEAADAVAQTGGRGFILGTGCVTPVTSPTANLYAARESVERSKAPQRPRGVRG